MNRKSLREQVFKLLFRSEFNDGPMMEDQFDFFFESGDMTVSEKDRDYITTKCKAVLEKIPEIDRLLGEKMDGWTVDRLPKVELAILRLGAYEILYDDTVHGTEKAGNFISIAFNKVIDWFVLDKMPEKYLEALRLHNEDMERLASLDFSCLK